MSASGHDAPSPDGRVAQLRSAFDSAFALPLAQPQPDGVELLIVSAGGQAHAIRTSELAGVGVDRKIMPLPGAATGVLGLCAAQGELVAVFELATLLGAPPAKTPPRWITLYRDKQLVALAFDELRESRRVALRDISPLELAPGRHAFSRHAVRLDTDVVHVLDTPALVESLRHQKR